MGNSVRWTPEQLEEFQRRAKDRGGITTHKCMDVEVKRTKADSATKPRDSLTDGVRQLFSQIRALKLPDPIFEFRFHDTRQWRFDLAWTDKRVAVEVEGGVYTNGRHTRGKGYEADIRKYNEAQLMGWRVLRYSTGQVRAGIAIDDLKRALA